MAVKKLTLLLEDGLGSLDTRTLDDANNQAWSHHCEYFLYNKRVYRREVGGRLGKEPTAVCSHDQLVEFLTGELRPWL